MTTPETTEQAGTMAPAEENISVPKAQLTRLLERIKDYEQKEDKIAECCFKVLDVMGLIDKETGEIVSDLKEGKNVMGRIFEAVKENISISQFMFNRKHAEKELAEKFSFLKDLMYIAQDYVNRKK